MNNHVERVPYRGTHYVEAAAYDRVCAQLDQERVQHAGCLTAAEGHTKDPAKQGDYGWSVAYQRTLELRQKFDALSERCRPVQSNELGQAAKPPRHTFLWRLFRR